jgi:hypothetical protein
VIPVSYVVSILISLQLITLPQIALRKHSVSGLPGVATVSTLEGCLNLREGRLVGILAGQQRSGDTELIKHTA